VEFHESFDDLETAHLSLNFLHVVITTTIVDTDYSHGLYQRRRPAVERHGDWPAVSKCPLPAQLAATLDLCSKQATWRRLAVICSCVDTRH